MVDLGDELILESYRIPWLIWIQLVVLFLLIILLYYFSISALDLSDSTTVTAAAPLSGGSHINNPTSSLHNSKAGENQKLEGEIGPSKGRRSIRSEEHKEEREGPSTKDLSHLSVFERVHHPCHFLGLAKQAFLKCLGFNSSSFDESSSTRKHKSSDEELTTSPLHRSNGEYAEDQVGH